jgi:hypothetical protein
MDEIGISSWHLTSDKEEFIRYTAGKINYSPEGIVENELWISNTELLFEKGIREQQPGVFNQDGNKFFFKTGGDLGFDIFAASFFLLSRYEEYLPFKKDSYGRYAHQNSLAWKNNFLEVPVVNTWIELLKQKLRNVFPSLQTGEKKFHFVPTYDIDEAYAYQHKSLWRTVGGITRSVFKGQWKEAGERLKTTSGNRIDPYDTFEWMEKLNEEYHLDPKYFFLVAAETGNYDKNISPSSPAMRKLIQQTVLKYKIGIHPSWQSGDKESLLQDEIKTLSELSGRQITDSRQHYIRFDLPRTFRKLVEAGIQSDYSMGYGSINGFRASVASPFYWYDLEKEKETSLLLFPFCFMDANSFFEQKYTVQQAFDELINYYQVVRSVKGTMITIWHNPFFGSSERFQGWKAVYENFLKKIS